MKCCISTLYVDNDRLLEVEVEIPLINYRSTGIVTASLEFEVELKGKGMLNELYFPPGVRFSLYNPLYRLLTPYLTDFNFRWDCLELKGDKFLHQLVRESVLPGVSKGNVTSFFREWKLEEWRYRLVGRCEITFETSVSVEIDAFGFDETLNLREIVHECQKELLDFVEEKTVRILNDEKVAPEILKGILTNITRRDPSSYSIDGKLRVIKVEKKIHDVEETHTQYKERVACKHHFPIPDNLREDPTDKTSPYKLTSEDFLRFVISVLFFSDAPPKLIKALSHYPTRFAIASPSDK